MQANAYWYVLYGDAPHAFFRDDERVTEAEWRHHAPLDQLRQLNRDLRDAELLLRASSRLGWVDATQRGSNAAPPLTDIPR